MKKMRRTFSLAIVTLTYLISSQSHAQTASENSEKYSKYFSEAKNAVDEKFEVYDLKAKQMESNHVIYEIAQKGAFNGGNTLNSVAVIGNIAADVVGTQQLFFNPKPLTNDKVMHFIAGYVIANGTTGLLQLIIPKTNKNRKLIAALGGIGASIIAGTLKEVADQNSPGNHFDNKDLIATGFGGITGSLVLSLSDVQRLFYPSK